METYVCESPRAFFKVKAETDSAALDVFKGAACRMIEKFGKMEKITGKAIPTAKEASTTGSGSLLASGVNCASTGKAIFDAIGSNEPYLGIAGADIIFDSSLVFDFGLPMHKAMAGDEFYSLKGILRTSLKEQKGTSGKDLPVPSSPEKTMTVEKETI